MNKPNTQALQNKDKLKVFGLEINFSLEDKIAYAILLILMYLIYSIRSNFYSIPFERDEGIYSYMGQLLLEGKTPYIDFYEIKFPGLFYLYAFVVKFFGANVEGMHKGFMWMNILTMIFIFFSVKNLFSSTAAVVAAATFSVVSITPALSGFTVQSEHGVSFFIALGFLFYSLIKVYDKIIFYFLFGVSLCMAVMIKQTAVFVALWGGVVLFVDFILTKPKNIKRTSITTLAFIIGALFVVILFFGIIKLKGAYSEMIHWTFEHSKQYSNSMPIEEGMKYFKYTRDAITKDYMFFWVHAMLAILTLILPSTTIKQKIFTVTIAIASFLTITPGYFFYGHYWIQLVPGLAVLSGITVYNLITFIESKLKNKTNTVKFAYLGVFALLFFKHINANKSFYYHPNYTQILRTTYGNNAFPESMEIANFIKQVSKPDDGIVLIGSEPQIYFYLNKKSPSRHAYFTSIVNGGEKPKAFQKEFIADVEKAKPKHLVFFNHQLSLLPQPGYDPYIFEWVNKYVGENYKVIGYADMINDGYSTNYVWGEQQAAVYKPQSQMYAVVFERK